MPEVKLIITIDGPAGSGKSTTARCVAKRLGYVYLDSGALYRAVTLAALRRQVDFQDADALTAVAGTSDIQLRSEGGDMNVYLDGENITRAIRMPEVTRAIGPVSGNRDVRTILLERQRQMAAVGGIVAEGRDMGTVVFPEAQLKYFMLATIEERAKRRQKDLARLDINTDIETIIEEMLKRDRDDSQRDTSPLRCPPGAVEIDTTKLSIDQQVDRIIEDAVRMGAKTMNPEVIIDPDAGFCPGVKRAIKLIDEELTHGDLVAIGPVIHNQRELQRLSEKGLKTVPQETISDKVDSNLQAQKVLIRTHGIGPDIRQRLQQADLQIVDATCPIVKKVQKMVVDFHRQGYQIAIIGKKGHAEVLGLLGHCDHQVVVIASESDVESLDTKRKTLVLAQTTIGKKKYDHLLEQIKKRVPDVVAHDTNCRYISERYDQVGEFARSVDVLIFVSGKESSNAQVLFDICRQQNKNAYKIESTEEINSQWFKHAGRIGISGAASTPGWQFDQVREYLLCDLSLR
ncbi:4-hydroxy-3-methylbut-2-enyl diphosphate reductase [candidate division KSB1 bacterium]|nr:4-hydroxy-3-methylbut-2-enyl diphosphate reductase [candidate division KSB1 bacterium]